MITLDSMTNRDTAPDPKPWMLDKTLVLVTKDGTASTASSDPYDDVPLESEGNWEMLDEVIDECIESGLYALDLETTGLDSRVFNGETRDKIVGICLSPDGEKGYYIPVRHKVGAEHNAPMSRVRSAMLRLTQSKSRAIFHNGKFDQAFLQFNGGEAWGTWDKVSLWEDTLILAYLRNSRSRNKGLKYLSEHELDMEMIEIYELFGHEKSKRGFNYDFSSLDPTDPSVVWYAASDAICTYQLYQLLAPQVITGDQHCQNAIYKIEKSCVAATRWMERCRIKVDKDKVAELIGIGQREFMDSLDEVYTGASELLGRDITPLYFLYAKEEIKATNPTLDIVGQISFMQLLEDCKSLIGRTPLHIDSKYPHLAVKRDRPNVTNDGREWPGEYDIMSAQQLGKMMDELNVPGLVRTEKSGQIKTNKEVLDSTIEKAGEKFPFMKKVKRFREVQKALSTYLLPLWEDADPTDDTVRINFNGHRVDTGRFSAPSSRNPKLDGGTRFPMHGTPATYDPNRPECLARIRECIISREPERFLVAIDYSGVELRIATNLSREPLWVKEFFRCADCEITFDQGDGTSTPTPPPKFCPNCGSDKIGDLHSLTAEQVYGKEARGRNDWKQLRQNAKATNFALSYGGGGGAVCRSTGCDKNEGYRIKRQFDAAYRGLAGWWAVTHKFAKKHKYVRTGFGRHYPVPDIDNEDRRFQAKAMRNAINGPIQGTSADITKMAMALCYKHCKNKGWINKDGSSGKVDMLITMHDELVFEIEGSVLEEAIKDLGEIMASNSIILNKRWPIPLTIDVEIGSDWTVPWDLSKMQKKGEYPRELAPFFKGAQVEPEPEEPVEEPVENGKAEATPENGKAESPTENGKDSETISIMASKPPREGGVFRYEISGPLTIGTVERLAKVINESANRGTCELKLSFRGEPLKWSDDPVLVNDTVFYVLAKRSGV